MLQYCDYCDPRGYGNYRTLLYFASIKCNIGSITNGNRSGNFIIIAVMGIAVTMVIAVYYNGDYKDVQQVAMIEQ